MADLRNARTAALGIVALLSIVGFADPSRADDPNMVFRTIETEHFFIHYHQGLEQVARLAASICEEVHENLAMAFDWEVLGQTDVVITDQTDSANGSTQTRHRPLILLYATAPVSGSSLEDYDSWLRTLIYHEYTHLNQLQIHSGVSRVINDIFGDIYLPNTLSPKWYHEGISVLSETRQTTGGRIRSASYNMMIRTAALDGNLLALDEVSNDTRDYPHGWSAFYLYGAMFSDYLYQRFGMEKVAAISHEYGASVLPYGLNRAYKRALGVDLVTVYDQWREHATAEAKQLRDELMKEGLTESRAVTADGESKGRPVFLPDGKHVVMAIGNGMEPAGIFRVPLDGSKPEELVLAGGSTPLSMDRSGRLFYTRSAPYKIYYNFNDVFALDREGQDPRRVTFGARALAAAISPRGDQLAITVNNAGTSKLVLADERGNQHKMLVDSAPGDQAFVSEWSPDGDKIAAVIRRGPKVDVALVDPQNGTLSFITDDRALEDDPVFDPSGRYLLFSSSRTGIDNIYAYDLAEQRLLQMTNVLTGATSPAVSPDGKTLAFVQYSSRGYDLHVMPFEPASARRAGPPTITREPMKPLPAPVTVESKPYNPLPSLLPCYFEFNAVTNADWEVTVQALTSVSDAVGRHHLGAQIDYDLENTVVSGRLAYSYDGLGPSLHLGLSHTVNPMTTGYLDGGESKPWKQAVTRGGLSMSYSIPGLDRSQGLSIGYSMIRARPTEKLTIDPDPQGDRPRIPEQYFRAGIELGWGYSDLVTSPYGISPHKGRRISADIDFYHPVLGGSQTLASFRYGWAEYIGLPWIEHHVLALQLSGGIYVSDPPGQSSFNVGGYAEQNIIDVIWNNSPAGQPSLRGYKHNAFSGDQYHSLKIEYRLPIWFTESGYKTIPVFLRHIQAGVFSDNTLISFDPLDRDDWRSSIGAEIVWVLMFGYYQTMSVRTGYAYGLMDQGIHELILVIGGGF